MNHPHPNRRFVPQAVLTRSGKINTAGASVNTVVRSVNTAGSKQTVNHPRSISNGYKRGYSQVTRPFNKYSKYKNSIFNKKVNTVRVKDTTARDKVVVSENKGKGVNAVKASTCWGNLQQKEYKEKGVIDSGCLRHMTGNKCYLTEYEDYDGGFVSFGDGKGRISGKVIAGNQTNGIAGTRDNIVIDPKVSEEDAEEKTTEMDEKKQTVHPNSTNSINTVSTPVSAAGPSFTKDDPSSLVNAAEASNAFEEHLFERFSPFKNEFTLPPVSNVTPMDDTGIFGNAYDDEDVGVEADLNNLETTMNVSPIPTTRIDKDHPKDQIIGDFNLAIQTKKMTNISDEHAMVCYINKQRRTNHKDYQNCLFAYFISQMEPEKVIQALEDPRWIEAMQEELLQFKLQKVWTLVNLPNDKRAIGTKWVFRNKKDKRGIVVINKPRLVAQEKALYGLHQAPRAWYLSTYLIENGFRRGTIDKTLFIKKDKGLQVQQKKDGIFIIQDKYVVGILKKFDFATMKTASTPMEPNKALIKDEEADSMDVHLYRSMIGSLMYLIASRPDIMDSPFNLEAFSDSDYARASLDRKSTTRGCQFLGKRLISLQCKNHTIVANSTTEAEYVATANCCGHVLWI
ncbi:putative reverse transcriptase, RNA-dependent DNA polymerase [Tanacetum coccineum]